jgi:hypothetical protein
LFIGGVVKVITIDLGKNEYYDDATNTFIVDEGGIVRFEYSLKAIYDWEAKWKKPFLKGGLTDNEMVDFFSIMALDPIKKDFITGETAQILADYIKDSNTATVFSDIEGGQGGNSSYKRGKLYTAEELYALMFAAQIPLDFENRNLNRLLVVLQIMASHNQPPKKMSTNDIYKQNAEINRQRRAEMNSKG